MIKKIATDKAPAAIGPYSQAYVAGDFLFISGQGPVDPSGATKPEGITDCAEQMCKNIAAILEEAGAGFDKVVKTTCFLADMGDFAGCNEVYKKYFTSAPARSCIAAKELPAGFICECEVIAYLGE